MIAGADGGGGTDLGPFLRATRDTARQALFFVDLLEPVVGRRWWHRRIQRAAASYRPEAMQQIHSLVLRVRLPDDCPRELREAWQEVETAVDADDAADRPQRLRQRLTAVLDASRAAEDYGGIQRLEPLVRRLAPVLPNGLRYLSRHLSLAVMTALLIAVTFGVEPVQGLLRNEGAEVFLFILLLPLVGYLHFCRFLWNYVRRRGVHPWDVGRSGFWRFRPLAQPPGRSIVRWPEGVGLRRAILLQQAMRTLAYLAGAGLAVGLFQVLANGAPATVPIILWIFWALLSLANQLDFWDYLLAGPLRLGVLTVVMVCVVCLRLGWGSTAFFYLFGFGGLLLAAYKLIVGARNGRKGKWFAPSPAWVGVVLLLLTAGAVLYLDRKEDRRAWRHDDGSEVIDHLRKDEWPKDLGEPVVVLVASGGGSRAAVYTALTLNALEAELPEVERHLQLISSVSGGSLASAAYVARRSGCGDGSTGLVTAAQGDFLQPTLLGALGPTRSRAEAIEAAWRNGPVGLESCSLGGLAEEWRRAAAGEVPFPVPLFNATTLDGHNVVITSLDDEHYVDEGQRKHALAWAESHGWFEDAEYRADPVTWVFHRDGIYSLQDLLGPRDILLASAVRASASFPFGFPVVRVKVPPENRENLVFSPVSEVEEIRLTDGGALSNSGMWSLFHLLVERLDELQERGVLLVFVEASKMPTYRGFQGTFNNLLGTIKDQGGISRNLHQRMLDVLELRYGNNLATVQLDLLPRERFNVFTTWALDRDSLQRLRVSFKARWCQARDQIEEKWWYLRQCRVPEPPDGCAPLKERLIDRDRPPLD